MKNFEEAIKAEGKKYAVVRTKPGDPRSFNVIVDNFEAGAKRALELLAVELEAAKAEVRLANTVTEQVQRAGTALLERRDATIAGLHRELKINAESSGNTIRSFSAQLVEERQRVSLAISALEFADKYLGTGITVESTTQCKERIREALGRKP